MALVLVEMASGFAIYQPTGSSGLKNCARWDAAPRLLNGRERSLDGGLRFSMEGNSYEAFRDLLTWDDPEPTVEEFKQAVLDAFAVWERVDPATGLGTNIRFVPDLATPVAGGSAGAEIDLWTDDNYPNHWSFLTNEPRSVTESFWIQNSGVTLSSGIQGYESSAISGTNIIFSVGNGGWWTLPIFKHFLAHEIGHALGLADVEFANGKFIDDNYNSQQPVSTLTNSFAQLIKVEDPAASPISFYSVATTFGGTGATGVDILMEHYFPVIFRGPSGPYLTPDDVAGRQFLYPFVEKPKLEIANEDPDVVLRWPDKPGWQPQRGPTPAGPWVPFQIGSSLQGNVRVLRFPRTLPKEFYSLELF